MRLLAIDPGNTESGWCLIDEDRRPIHFGKSPNEEIIDLLYEELNTSDWLLDRAAIEMVASYGMPVGRDVFETCVWIGRFLQVLDGQAQIDLTYRRDIKLHHCHTSKAKDTNVRQALVDRFAPGQPNHGKGTKAAPGWFYGFRADIWQAYALAVYAADLMDASTIGRTA